MGEQLSTVSAPPEPPAAAAPPIPAAAGPLQPPPPAPGILLARASSRPQREGDAGAPPQPAEPQGRVAEESVGAPPEEGPGSEAGSSSNRRLPLRPVYCTVYCVESDRRHGGPPAASPPLSGEGGGDARSTAAPPPSGQRKGGGRNSGSTIEVDLYLLPPEPFSGLISGDFGPLLVLTCRVCLEEKPLKPLPCCKKPVCEECLKRYLSSQVKTRPPPTYLPTCLPPSLLPPPLSAVFWPAPMIVPQSCWLAGGGGRSPQRVSCFSSFPPPLCSPIRHSHPSD